MPLPDRPVPGADIETDWGQQVHDYTFAPSGLQASTSSATAVSTTYLGLDLDTPDDDPGGFLDVANTQIEIPTGKEGLYLLTALFLVTGSVDGQIILAGYALNGTIATRDVIYGETGSTVQGGLAQVSQFSAGDILDFRAKRVGAPNVNVSAVVSLVRLGAEYGA